jgi:hypothetical protein
MRRSVICALVGLVLYIAGFFLPAVRFPPDPRPEAQWGPGLVSHEFPGYICAGVTLLGAAAFFRHPDAAGIPTALIGWINPLVLLYLFFSISKKLHRTRPFLAGIIAVACLVMWIQLSREHVTLLPGHYLWIAGIALILSAPLADQLSARGHQAHATT